MADLIIKLCKLLNTENWEKRNNTITKVNTIKNIMKEIREKIDNKYKVVKESY